MNKCVCLTLDVTRKLAANRQSLWNEFNDPTKTRDEIIKNVPTGIDKVYMIHEV